MFKYFVNKDKNLFDLNNKYINKDKIKFEFEN
jgi:hypothetical protein